LAWFSSISLFSAYYKRKPLTNSEISGIWEQLTKTVELEITMPITPTLATAEGMPKPKVVRLRPDLTRDQQDAALTDAMADCDRMASILRTLLETLVIDHGPRRCLTIARQDASDIRFAGEQLSTMLAHASDLWRRIP
jgi:hypothetical protein